MYLDVDWMKLECIEMQIGWSLNVFIFRLNEA